MVSCQCCRVGSKFEDAVISHQFRKHLNVAAHHTAVQQSREAYGVTSAVYLLQRTNPTMQNGAPHPNDWNQNMPLSPPAPREPIHHRDIDCRGYRREDGLWDIEGHLVDSKRYPLEVEWRGELQPGEPIHEMWLRLTVDEDLMIHACEAVTEHSPYPVCPEGARNFGKLAGIQIGPGWTREVQARVGGTRGCTHLVELLRPLATTAFQTLVASKHHEDRLNLSIGGKPPVLLNTCHAHADYSPVTKERWPSFYVGP